MFPSPRRALYKDVIAFPATKSAGAATLSSNVLRDFETTAFGAVNFQLVAADLSQVTDTLTIEPFVSFDEGTTWIQAGAYSDIANGSGTLSALKSLKYVPRLRVDGVFDGSGALAAGHGASVHVEMREVDPEYARRFDADVVTVPTTVADGVTTNGTSVEVPANTGRVAAIVSADPAQLTDVSVMLQSSFDGVYWWDLLSSATDISAVMYSEIDMDQNMVGTYVRANVITAATTGAISTGHNMSVNLLSFSR